MSQPAAPANLNIAFLHSLGQMLTWSQWPLLAQSSH